MQEKAESRPDIDRLICDFRLLQILCRPQFRLAGMLLRSTTIVDEAVSKRCKGAGPVRIPKEGIIYGCHQSLGCFGLADVSSSAQR